MPNLARCFSLLREIKKCVDKSVFWAYNNYRKGATDRRLAPKRVIKELTAQFADVAVISFCRENLLIELI